MKSPYKHDPSPSCLNPSTSHLTCQNTFQYTLLHLFDMSILPPSLIWHVKNVHLLILHVNTPSPTYLTDPHRCSNLMKKLRMLATMATTKQYHIHMVWSAKVRILLKRNIYLLEFPSRSHVFEEIL
jgi:hypothetical protein